mgnify:CR=1 FL=1
MFKYKNALISVFDKTDVELIAKFLIKKNFNIYSTGGTSKILKKLQIPYHEVSEYTGQKEILGGRVKTLHPKIFGGLLSTQSNKHQKELNKEKIINFDLLIINLYPFQETLERTTNSKEIIEMIDIGGHSLIRAAIKNYEKTLTIVDPKDYKLFIKNYRNINNYNKKLAIKAMRLITEYDIAISKWFEGNETKQYPLRYGENPQQKAIALIDKGIISQLSGDKRLSYNNLLDLDAAINIVYGFKTKKHTCTIIKHNIPCGAAIKDSQISSFNKSLSGDPLSAFGGIVAFNQKLDINTAKKISKLFFEIVAAPNFEKGVIEILGKKKNLRVLRVKHIKQKIEQRSIFAGTLLQEANVNPINIQKINGKNLLNKEQSNFFINVLKSVKSNAITIFDKDSLLSQSGGQTSRIDALENCIKKLKSKHQIKKNQKLFLFSDAFFPFTDSIKCIIKTKLNIDCYVPMGSLNDEKIKNYVKKVNLNYFSINNRHFKH